MRKLYIIHTGGTIGMEQATNGAVILQENHPLANFIKESSHNMQIFQHQLFHLPSPHMTPTKMLVLKEHILDKLNDYDGFVITHGTDTLEETAYFLHLTLSTNKPVIITGSMRPSNELGSDALSNLQNAIRVAASDIPSLRSVFVVMNEEIHHPSYVTKTHTTNIGTFQSPAAGPVGIVIKEKISLYHHGMTEEKYHLSALTKEVVLLKAYTGMRPDLLEALLQTPIHGLVIESFGQGNVPPTIVKPIQHFLDNGIPVLLVSRCFQGFVEGTYDYLGGGKQLKDIGVLFSNGLNGQKARLKLSVLLSCHVAQEDLQKHFI